MRDITTCRTVEIRQANGSWLPAQIQQLEAGDVFRILESDGTQAVRETLPPEVLARITRVERNRDGVVRRFVRQQLDPPPGATLVEGEMPTVEVDVPLPTPCVYEVVWTIPILSDGSLGWMSAAVHPYEG